MPITNSKQQIIVLNDFLRVFANIDDRILSPDSKIYIFKLSIILEYITKSEHLCLAICSLMCLDCRAVYSYDYYIQPGMRIRIQSDPLIFGPPDPVLFHWIRIHGKKCRILIPVQYDQFLLPSLCNFVKKILFN